MQSDAGIAANVNLENSVQLHYVSGSGQMKDGIIYAVYYLLRATKFDAFFALTLDFS